MGDWDVLSTSDEWGVVSQEDTKPKASPFDLANKELAKRGVRVASPKVPDANLPKSGAINRAATAFGAQSVDIIKNLPSVAKQALAPMAAGTMLPGRFSSPALEATSSIVQDPVEAATALQPIAMKRLADGDIAGGIGETGANVAALVLASKLGKSKLPEGSSLKASAAKNYERVLAPTTKPNKFTTQKIVPEMVERTPIAATRKGLLAKAEANADAANVALDDAWAKIPATDKMSPKAVVDHLENYKKDFTVQGQNGSVPVDPTAIRHIDAVQKIFSDMGDSVSPQTMRRTRQILDQKVANAKGFAGKTLDEGTMLDVTKEASNAIRRELVKQYPDLSVVNAEYTFWRRMGQVLNDTVQRKIGQATPMGEQILRAGGTAAGYATHGIPGAAGVGGALWGLRKLTTSTAWNTVSAATKSRIADALGGGNIGQVNAISMVELAKYNNDKKKK